MFALIALTITIVSLPLKRTTALGAVIVRVGRAIIVVGG